MTGSSIAGTLMLYLDGALVDSNTSLTNGITFNGTGGFGAAPNLTIGAARPDSANAGYRSYDGLLDELAIYDSVLTPAQIRARVSSIPEPGSALLLSLGGLMLMRRRVR